MVQLKLLAAGDREVAVIIEPSWLVEVRLVLSVVLTTCSVMVLCHCEFLLKKPMSC